MPGLLMRPVQAATTSRLCFPVRWSSALEHERTERRYYNSLANEIITRLDVVGQTIDDVVKRAEQEVYRQHRENPRAELPDIKVPSFLRKVEAALNGNGTVANPE
jgi:hypothetical protein